PVRARLASSKTHFEPAMQGAAKAKASAGLLVSRPDASHQLSLLTLNVADSAKAFEAAKAYMIEKVHVIALLEVCASSQQAQAFVSQASRLGYHAFHVPGTTTQFRRGYDVHSGGVAVLVRHSIKVQPVRSWQGVVGQFVALDFGSFFMVAVYRRPGDDSVNDMNQALCEALWARRARQPWILLGDFNWTPEENEWLEMQPLLVPGTIAAPDGLPPDGASLSMRGGVLWTLRSKKCGALILPRRAFLLWSYTK
ncbi:unnamed protein product, partial [Symbiodinium sp. CCMP2456]